MSGENILNITRDGMKVIISDDDNKHETTGGIALLLFAMIAELKRIADATCPVKHDEEGYHYVDESNDDPLDDGEYHFVVHEKGGDSFHGVADNIHDAEKMAMHIFGEDIFMPDHIDIVRMNVCSGPRCALDKYNAIALERMQDDLEKEKAIRKSKEAFKKKHPANGFVMVEACDDPHSARFKIKHGSDNDGDANAKLCQDMIDAVRKLWERDDV